MHKMLQKIGVLSFSEPYWLEKVLDLPSLGVGRNTIVTIFSACAAVDVLLVRRSLPAHPPVFGEASTLGSGFVSFNPKGRCCSTMKAIIQSMPNAKHMFMYRDVREVAESFGSILHQTPRFLDRVLGLLMAWKPRQSIGSLRPPPSLEGGHAPMISRAVAEARHSGRLKEPNKPTLKATTINWLEAMCLWKEMMEDGHPEDKSALSLRMKDFTRKDPELIEAILRFFLGEPVEVGEDAVALALEAFNKHSQAGNLMARSSHLKGGGVPTFLKPEDVRDIEACVAGIPAVGAPDFVFPDSAGLQDRSP